MREPARRALTDEAIHRREVVGKELDFAEAVCRKPMLVLGEAERIDLEELSVTFVRVVGDVHLLQQFLVAEQDLDGCEAVDERDGLRGTIRSESDVD